MIIRRSCVLIFSLLSACALTAKCLRVDHHHHHRRPPEMTMTMISQRLSAVLVGAAVFCSPALCSPEPAHAMSLSLSSTMLAPKQSAGWELARQKRTQAIKEMANRGIVKVSTDDAGNQFLALPWLPDKKIPYKSLPLAKRLQNEVCAGAFGEISKDILLHAVDTLKTRKQASKKEGDDINTNSTSSAVIVPQKNPFTMLKGLYAGFPVVFISSIPQGGAFFLVKKSVIEGINLVSPTANAAVIAIVPIVFSVMAYWAFRTPAEVIKTQVQTGQSATCFEAVEEFRARDNGRGLARLWKYYPVMLFLDIPFQVLNFALLTSLSEGVSRAGIPVSVLSRLFCGVTCGMISAGVTCPIDVCKTRILSRDRAAVAAADLAQQQALLVQDDATITTAQMNAAPILEELVGESGAEEGSSVQLLKRPKTLEVGVSASEESVVVGSEGGVGMEMPPAPIATVGNNGNVLIELVRIYQDEGLSTLFLGLRQRLLYTGLANGIRLAAYGTSRMDLMMRSLDGI